MKIGARDVFPGSCTSNHDDRFGKYISGTDFHAGTDFHVSVGSATPNSVSRNL